MKDEEKDLTNLSYYEKQDAKHWKEMAYSLLLVFFICSLAIGYWVLTKWFVEK